MDHENQLFQPLLYTTNFAAAVTTASGLDDNDADNIKVFSSNTPIIFRLLSIIFIGVISVWANHEASKGFDVSIINEAKDSPEGKRFDLFYVANDKAIKILLNTSAFVENILYPDNNQTKKNVQRVTLRLTGKNTTRTPTVDMSKSDEFVINISSSIMRDSNVNYALISAIQRDMARIWLWDCESRAPPWLMDGLVEYISILAGFRKENYVFGGESPEISQLCWDDKDPRIVAEFLDICEEVNKGFIRRLNQAMRDHWDNRAVDNTLRIKAKYFCDSL